MKKKSLLILLPIAAMAFAGCTPVKKPCSEAEITIPLGKNSVSVEKGNTVVLEYQISDDDCKSSIEWTTSDPNVATVANGVVTGVAKGTAIIKANNKASWMVTVTEPVVAVTLTGLTCVRAEKNYKVGDVFDKSSVIIQANYSNGTSKQVDGWTIDKTGPLTIDDKAVVVSYTEGGITKTVQIDITVTEEPAPEEVVLTEIKATTMPNKVSYFVGEVFDPTGMVITAYYSNQSPKIVDGWTIDKTGPLTKDDKAVVVSYTEGGITKTVDVVISVSEDPPVVVQLVEIDVTGAKDNYKEGELFDASDAIVVASYSDTSSREVSGWTYDKTEPLTKDDTVVVFSYTEGGITKTKDYPITVTSDPTPSIVKLVGIEITVQPDVVEYFVGDIFDPSGMVVMASYSDGNSHVVNATCSTPDMNKAGVQTVTVSYTEDEITKTDEFDILVKERTVTTITPQKAIELMDAAGDGKVVQGLQQVKGICASGSKYDSQHKEYTTGFEGVSNFKLQFTDTNNILSGGSPDGMEIVVEGYLEKYEGKYQLSYLPPAVSPTGEKFTPNLISAQPVQHEGVLTEISVSAAHREFYKGSTFVEETVTAHYSDGATATVKATFSGYDMNTLGEQTVTVSYTEKGVTKQTTYTINVIERGSGHAGTLEDPLTTAEAVTIANGLAETTDSKNPIASEGMYVKGVVTEFKETFSADFGNYSVVIGGDFTLWRIKNGPDFAKFNDGDIELGDEVIAFVYIMNFKGTPESTSNSYVHSVQKAGDTKVLESIEIVGSLTKSTYVEGQTYSAAGLSVKGHYDDGSEGTVTATITLNKTTAALGDTEIIASATFKEITAEPKTFAVIVTEKVPVIGGSVYTFKNDKTQAQNMGTWTSEQFMAHVEVDGGEIITGMKDVTNAYIGGNGGSGDATWNIWDSLKIGKSNAKGEITLLLDGTASFSKIKVSAIGSRDDGTLTINEITQNVTKKAMKGDLEPIELEYEITGGITELKLSSKDAASNNYGIVITRIEFVGGDTPTPIKELSSISIEGALAKTTYTEGEAYSAEGLSVVGHYSDGSSAVVPGVITLDKTSATLGDTSITASVEYGDFSDEKQFVVLVTAKKVVQSISVSNNHRTFDQYSEFVPETVIATFNIGDPEIVQANFSTPDMTTSGEKEISVTYTDAYGNVASTSYNITVIEAKEPELINIAIDGSLAKSEYKVGETYSTEGLSVLGYYDNETTKVLTATITFNKTTAALGDTSIIASVEYGDFSDEKEFNVTVAKVDENTIDVSGVDSYPISADDLGLGSYGSGSNTNFAWTDLAKHTSGTLQGNHKTGDSPKDSELHNVRAFSKNITYIKFNIGFAAGDAATGAIRFGTSALPTSNSTEIGANTNYALNKVGDFIVSAAPGCGYFSLKWTKGASYYTSIEVHFDEYKADGVQGVSLDKTATTLAVGANETLTATVSPASATNKQVTWSSSAPAVATVDSNGKVTAVAEGTAIITVTTVDGSKTATCTVTVTSEGGGGGSETTSTPIDLGGDSKVVFGGVTYEKSIKAGTTKVAGNASIIVPSGAKKLVFFAAGWNKENVTISVSGGGISKSLKLTADTGVSGNGPTYTLASSTEASFKFEIDVSSLSGETTLALAATAGKRFVVWNASYTK